MIDCDDLHEALGQHLSMVGFCKHCACNIHVALNLLMGEVDESLVDDYDPSLYNGLEVVDSRGIHDGNNDDNDKDDDSNMSKVLVYEGLVVKLIEIYTEFVTRDEIAMATNVETRHANNVAMGQQEVLAVIGSLLLSRICGLWYPYRAEDQGRCFFRHIACEIIRRLERSTSDKLINSTAGISNRNNDGTAQ